MHRCPNRACPSRGLETLINWVQGPADLDGVGEQTIRLLWERGLVRSLPDLYRLTKEQLLELDGFAEISAIECDRADRRVARAGAVLARPPRPQHRRDRLDPRPEPRPPRRRRGHAARATPEDLAEVEGFGPDRAEAVAEWFADEDNRALVEELRAIGLRFEVAEEDRPAEGPLTGSQYVITGTLESFTRDEAKAALEALGAKVSDSVSKKTTGVVVGENPGSKVGKAEKAGVPILGEAELKALLGR